jgi:crossover junction endodeoxyribonuclease RuvC
LNKITVLGIDPGLSLTGFGIINKNGEALEVVDYGIIKTSVKKTIPERLKELHEGLSKVLASNRIDQVAVEKIFFNTNLKTVVSVSEARGVILFTLNSFNKKIFEYTPLEAKKAVLGKGRATKEEITASITNILCLEKEPRPDDVADALAIALCHIFSIPYLEKIDVCTD